MWIGTAGWSLPREMQAHFPGPGTHLERYARVFPCVEINSTFHRPHRPSTFARWAASVPPGFRFSLKLPRTISHTAKLVGARTLVEDFLASVEPLGAAADCLLVQLPPKLDFDPRAARDFLSHLRDRFERSIAIEPRHEGWFGARAERLLRDLRIARVAADPPRAADAPIRGDGPGSLTTGCMARHGCITHPTDPSTSSGSPRA